MLGLAEVGIVALILIVALAIPAAVVLGGVLLYRKIDRVERKIDRIEQELRARE